MKNAGESFGTNPGRNLVQSVEGYPWEDFWDDSLKDRHSFKKLLSGNKENLKKNLKMKPEKREPLRNFLILVVTFNEPPQRQNNYREPKSTPRRR